MNKYSVLFNILFGICISLVVVFTLVCIFFDEILGWWSSYAYAEVDETDAWAMAMTDIVMAVCVLVFVAFISLISCMGIHIRNRGLTSH